MGLMRRFSQIIDEIELRDLPIQGGRYTWKGGLNNRRMAKLDRFLVSDDWNAHFGALSKACFRNPPIITSLCC